MRFLSVCSGIEAASVAWCKDPLNWTCAGVAEIEAFPNAVLKHHYPDVPNFGDFTKITAEDVGGPGSIDLLVGGTPCQDFSVAGLRAGLAGDRGRLTIEFVRLAGRLRPRWVVWENVPGVLSADDGNAYGIFLGALAELGYGTAYRILDAQYAGVPQRRRRVFLVGYLGDWRRAGAVLFESHSLSGHPAPRRKARQTTPSLTSSGAGVSRVKGAARSDDIEWVESVVNAQADADVAPTLQAHATKQWIDSPMVAGTLSVLAFANTAGETALSTDEHSSPPVTGSKGNPPMLAFNAKDYGADAGEISPTLRAGHEIDGNANGGVMPAIAFNAGAGAKARSMGESEDVSPSMMANGNASTTPSVAIEGYAARRLTPRECERLQKFPELSARVIIHVCPTCSDQHGNPVHAALLNLRSLKCASRAEGDGSSVHAQDVDAISNTRLQGDDQRVVLNARIDCDRATLDVSVKGLSTFASTAVESEWSRRLALSDALVLDAVAMLSKREQATCDGRAASQANTNASILPENGSKCAPECGGETQEPVVVVRARTDARNGCSTCTTLRSGPGTRSYDSILKILCCSAIRAIAGCIPEIISSDDSFDVDLIVSGGYTLVPYPQRSHRKNCASRTKPDELGDETPDCNCDGPIRIKPAADGPRYKALGNSMCVGVMEWIGERIDLVERLCAEMTA